jgi:hypothetical protein
MRKLVACVALAVAAAVPATLALDAGPAHADETNSCRWYVDGQDYSAGTVKVEDWGVSRTPDGRWVRTLRYFACRTGGWWDLVYVENVEVQGPDGRPKPSKQPILESVRAGVGSADGIVGLFNTTAL